MPAILTQTGCLGISGVSCLRAIWLTVVVFVMAFSLRPFSALSYRATVVVVVVVIIVVVVAEIYDWFADG